MTPHDRAARADSAAREMEFLGPAFAVVETAYADRLTELAAETPWETAKIAKLAAALKIARMVRAQIEQVVADGPVARSEISRAAQIETIRTDKRRILGL